MSQLRGLTKPLSCSQRHLCDLIHASRNAPVARVGRRIILREVVVARETAGPEISWKAIFLKAYALVAAASPNLRRAYLSFPKGRLYEHPVNVITVEVARRAGMLLGQIRQPETLGLVEIDRHLRQLEDQPLESIACYRRTLRLTRLPGWLRRMVWWVGAHVSGARRAQLVGTTSLVSAAELGAEVLCPPSLLTPTLSYGTLADDGGVEARLSYDPRALDGQLAARALADLEEALTYPVLAELRYHQSLEAA